MRGIHPGDRVMSASPFRDMSELRIVDETALDVGDTHLIFTRDELNRMSNTMLRRLAANANTDVINGKSTRLEIVSYLNCQKSLIEFE